MSISARSFLDRVAEKGLLEDQVVQELRTHVEQSLFEVSCEQVAKLLVDKGHLTAFQANKLVAELGGGAPTKPAPAAPAASSAPAAPPAPAASSKPAPAPKVERPAVSPPPPPPPSPADDDELGLADLGDGEAAKPAAPAPKAPPPPPPPPAAKAPAAKPSVSPAAKSPAKPAAPPAAAGGDDDIILLEDADTPAVPAAPAKPAGKGGAPSAPSGKSGAEKSGSRPAAPAKPAGPKSPAKAPGKAEAAGPSSGRSAGAGKPSASEPSGGLQPLPDAGLTPLGDLGAGFDLGGADAFGAPGGMGAAGMGDPFANPADPFATGAAGAAAPAGAPGAAPAAPGFKKAKTLSWDSPLFLIVGGAVILVLLGTPFLWFVLTRGTASEMFEAAEADYKAQSYTNAIAKYDKFLKTYPEDPNASLARVRRGLATIRGAVEGAGDARSGLVRAQEVIPELTTEDRFADARPELAGVLPAIASGLAKQAKEAGSGEKAEELVGLATKAMELVNDSNNIPSSLRAPIQKSIDDIQRTIDEANRNIRQAKQLVASLEQMEKSLAEGKTSEAFEVRRQLLKEFPALEKNEQLVASVLKVAAAERDRVEASTEPIAATTEDEPAPADVRQVVLANRRGETATDGADQIAYVLARGSVYALEVASGKILWRRYVGFETFVHPQPVAKRPGADALAADAQRSEIVRLEAKSGKPVWRLAIGERFATPVIRDERAWVTTLSGRVIEVDLATGNSARSARLPQGTAVEAGGAAQSPLLYQAGGHSNLYVLAADSLACREVYYLGHRPGTIAVPPVAALNHLFVAENAGSDYALIHVLALDEQGLKLTPPEDQEPFRVPGNVVTSMIQVKNRILVTTDRASLLVLEIDAANKRKPVKTIATRVSDQTEPIPSQVTAEGAQLWIGNDRFMAYDIQASREQLAPKWVKHELEWFVAPLQKFGGTLLHVRRRRGSAGVTVSAVKPDTGVPIWQTDLAPPVTYVGHDAEKNQIVAITSQGDLYRLTKEAIEAGQLDKPTESAEVAGSATTFSFVEAGRIDEHRVALVSAAEPNAVLVHDPRRAGDELAVVRLDVAGGVINSTPVFFAGGVAATTEGGLWWLSVDGGKNLGLPFQPKLGPAEKLTWLRPAVAVGASEFVAADSRKRLYRVVAQGRPQPHLASATEADAGEAPLGGLAVGKQAAYGWVRGPSTDLIKIYRLPGLNDPQEFSLQGRLMQGPWTVGDAVYLVTDKEGLVALGDEPQARWTAPLPDGLLAGPPRLEGESLLLASLRGTLWKASAATGEVGGKLELKQPLAGPPAPYANRWLAPGADGVLYAAPAPP